MPLRARKAGDAFEVERKMEKRWDEEEKIGTPARISNWINKSLEGQLAQPCPTGGAANFHAFFKDGVALCQIMNKLLVASNLPPVGFRRKANQNMVALSNLDSFLSAAKQYGVSEMSLFNPSDVVDGRKGTLLNLINCVNQLGILANMRNFQPAYQESPPPTADWCAAEYK